MDKITKVQEVSSFIVNFDNKQWNEVILRLTIIGIRYVTNNYKNIFSWKLKDLNEIIDQLNKTHISLKSINNNKSNKKKKDTKKEYNYNYSNSTILKNKENNSAIKKIKNNLNNFINKSDNNSNNNSMLLLSERNSIDSNKYYQKVKKSKGPNVYLKNKNNRNSILSLKQSSLNENITNKNINVVVSNFPFNKNNDGNNGNNIGYNIDKMKNKNNYIYDFNQEQNDYIYLNKIKKNSTFDEKKFNNKHSFIIERKYSALNEYIPYHTYEEKKTDKNSKFLDDVNLIKNYNYKNSSQEFISELRKMSHSKEYIRNINNSKKIIANINYHHQPRLNISYSSRLISKKNNPIKSYMKDKNNLSFSSKEKLDKIKCDLSIIKKENDKEIKEEEENNTTTNINKKYNFKEKNDNLETNFQYGIQNHDFSLKKENQPIKLSINNLKNQNLKPEKIKTNLITEVKKKYKPNMNFDYTLNKENINKINLEHDYKPPNTDRYSCNYLNEIQTQTNKNISSNNNSIIIKSNIEEENKDKIKDKDDKKI